MKKMMQLRVLALLAVFSLASNNTQAMKKILGIRSTEEREKRLTTKIDTAQKAHENLNEARAARARGEISGSELRRAYDQVDRTSRDLRSAIRDVEKKGGLSEDHQGKLVDLHGRLEQTQAQRQEAGKAIDITYQQELTLKKIGRSVSGKIEEKKTEDEAKRVSAKEFQKEEELRALGGKPQVKPTENDLKDAREKIDRLMQKSLDEKIEKMTPAERLAELAKAQKDAEKARQVLSDTKASLEVADLKLKKKNPELYDAYVQRVIKEREVGYTDGAIKEQLKQPDSPRRQQALDDLRSKLKDAETALSSHDNEMSGKFGSKKVDQFSQQWKDMDTQRIVTERLTEQATTKPASIRFTISELEKKAPEFTPTTEQSKAPTVRDALGAAQEKPFSEGVTPSKKPSSGVTIGDRTISSDVTEIKSSPGIVVIDKPVAPPPLPPRRPNPMASETDERTFVPTT
ncbi:hypothetical protein JST56_01435 [Candidatus Dependentiae bacterium]|nr:hypothetical protein [Candidatus Dependentiae bacterium]